MFVTEYMHGRKMREEAASDTFLLTYTPPPMHSARHAHRMASTTDALLDRLLRCASPPSASAPHWVLPIRLKSPCAVRWS